MQRRVLAVLTVAAAMSMVAGSCSGAPDARDASSDGAPSRASHASGYPGSDVPVSAPLAGAAPTSGIEGGTAAAASTFARRGASEGFGAKSAAELAEEPSAAVRLPAQGQQSGSMLIRSGHATVEVDSVDAGIARVRQLAQRTGAVIANTTVQAGREEQRSASLELRVPSDRFDAVVNGLAPIGKVESVSVTAQDVGEEFVDLTARLANARRLEARLIELLANRTGRLSDVLTVERELARVREQIERYEGRLRYLQSRVAVSSFTVVVHEPPPVVASHPGENIIAEAFVEAWRRFVRLTAGFIASLGVLIPLGALGLGAFVLGRRYLPRREAAAEGAR